jgi:hypothetical protein
MGLFYEFKTPRSSAMESHVGCYNTLSLEEQIELDDYERVGHVLSLMKSEARQVLKKLSLS